MFLASNSLVLPIVLCWVCLFYLLFTNIFSFRFCYFYFVYFTLSCFLKILGSVWRLLEFLAFLFPFVLGSNNSRFFLHRFRFAGTTARGQTIDQISARAYLFAACVRSKRIWVSFPRNDGSFAQSRPSSSVRWKWCQFVHTHPTWWRQRWIEACDLTADSCHSLSLFQKLLWSFWVKLRMTFCLC